jgi:hypothetical protein
MEKMDPEMDYGFLLVPRKEHQTQLRQAQMGLPGPVVVLILLLMLD